MDRIDVSKELGGNWEGVPDVCVVDELVASREFLEILGIGVGR
jgi:hypothetical protein